jgi:hypothetical protein
LQAAGVDDAMRSGVKTRLQSGRDAFLTKRGSKWQN